MNKYILIAAIFVGGLMVGFSASTTNKKANIPTYSNTLQESISPPQMLPLIWESKVPEGKKWSEHLYSEIETNFDVLDKASDMQFFCPNYANLAIYQKINIWAQLFAAMSYYESSFNPTSRYLEPTAELDPVTKTAIISEGLLQLGYSDVLFHRCKFNWERDSKLASGDPNKTILNPYTNLSCGVKIMCDQINKYGAIIIDRGAYWAVIKLNHRNQKLDQIKKIISGYEMCNKK